MSEVAHEELSLANLEMIDKTWAYVADSLRSKQLPGDPVICQRHLNALQLVEAVKQSNKDLIESEKGKKSAKKKAAKRAS